MVALGQSAHLTGKGSRGLLLEQRTAVIEGYLHHLAVRVVSGGGNSQCRHLGGTAHADVGQRGLLRGGDAHGGVLQLQRVVLAELPYLVAGLHAPVVGNPVSLVLQFHKHHLYAVVAGSPGVAGDAGGTAVVLGHLGRGGTAVVVNPYVQVALDGSVGTHVVARAVGVDDGDGADTGIGRSTAHGVAADGGEGCYQVGNLVHGVVGEHAAHGEAGEVDTLAVYLVQLDHLVNEGLDEVDVTVAADVPHPGGTVGIADAVGEHGDELRRVGHALNGEHAFLVVGTLVGPVTGDEQWAVVTQVLGDIHDVFSLRIVDSDDVGRGRQAQRRQQKDGK